MNIEISPKEYEKFLNWYDANMYCQLLVIDEKNDWRLPTKDELNDIHHSDNDLGAYYHWSSTDYTYTGYYAWGHYLSLGLQDYYDKNYDFYVRPVRSLII